MTPHLGMVGGGGSWSYDRVLNIITPSWWEGLPATCDQRCNAQMSGSSLQVSRASLTSVTTPKNGPQSLLQPEKMADCVDHGPIRTDSITDDEVLAYDLSPTFCLKGALLHILVVQALKQPSET